MNKKVVLSAFVSMLILSVIFPTMILKSAPFNLELDSWTKGTRTQFPFIIVSPEDTLVYRGETFTVDIIILDVIDLQGYEFKLGFNNTILNATDVVAGPVTPPDSLLGPIDPVTYEWTPLLNVSDGFVWVIAVLPRGISFTGSGIRITINFTALAMGNSILDLYDTVVGDSQAQPINHAALDGWVVVTGIGDVNADGKVDFLDLTLVLTNVGPIPPSPSECDINGDNTINVLDVILVLINLGPV